MKPLLKTAGAVEWEFRCHSKEVPGHPWDWQCRSGDGTVLAKSKSYFRSLNEAVADAGTNGFGYAGLPPATRLQRQNARTVSLIATRS